jgi:hypothetical protein
MADCKRPLSPSRARKRFHTGSANTSRRATKIRCLKPVIGCRLKANFRALSETGLSETRLNGVEPRADLRQPVGGLPVKTAN